MRIALLEVDSVPEALKPRFGTHHNMVGGLFDPAHEIRAFDVRSGQLPTALDPYDALVLGGSPASVYDDLPWIEPLRDFLVASKGHVRMIGICFGHQLMAEVFGGRVERSPKGRALGTHIYDIVAKARWMDDVAEIASVCSHQDQVVVLPPSAQVLARSAFTPYAMLAYPQEGAISFQFHPEWPVEYARALIERAKGKSLSTAEADSLAATLRRVPDRARFQAWISAFLDDREWLKGHPRNEQNGDLAQFVSENSAQPASHGGTA